MGRGVTKNRRVVRKKYDTNKRSCGGTSVRNSTLGKMPNEDATLSDQGRSEIVDMRRAEAAVDEVLLDPAVIKFDAIERSY